MQCFTLTPKWPRMLLDFNLLWFLILCIVFDTGRLLCRSIFTSFAPATQQKKYIYIYMNIKPGEADFYFNKVPLHAAVFFLFPLFGQSILQKLSLFMESSSLTLLKSADDTHGMWMISSLLFRLRLFLFPCLWLTLLKRIYSGEAEDVTQNRHFAFEESENSTCTKQ